jgi:hypothetical protein
MFQIPAENGLLHSSEVLDKITSCFFGYFSENYFTLLPGEKRMIELDVDKSKSKIAIGNRRLECIGTIGKIVVVP